LTALGAIRRISERKNKKGGDTVARKADPDVKSGKGEDASAKPSHSILVIVQIKQLKLGEAAYHSQK
jgi:hypothetical protein